MPAELMSPRGRPDLQRAGHRSFLSRIGPTPPPLRISRPPVAVPSHETRARLDDGPRPDDRQREAREVADDAAERSDPQHVSTHCQPVLLSVNG